MTYNANVVAEHEHESGAGEEGEHVVQLFVLEAEETALLYNYRSATPTAQAGIRQVGVVLTEPAAKRGQSGTR